MKSCRCWWTAQSDGCRPRRCCAKTHGKNNKIFHWEVGDKAATDSVQRAGGSFQGERPVAALSSGAAGNLRLRG